MGNTVVVFSQMASSFDHSHISPAETFAVIFEGQIFCRIKFKFGYGTPASVIDPVHGLEDYGHDKTADQKISQ